MRVKWKVRSAWEGSRRAEAQSRALTWLPLPLPSLSSTFPPSSLGFGWVSNA